MEGLEYGTTTMVIALEHWKKVRFPLMHGLNVNIYEKNTTLGDLLLKSCASLTVAKSDRFGLVIIHSNFLKSTVYWKNF